MFVFVNAVNVMSPFTAGADVTVTTGVTVDDVVAPLYASTTDVRNVDGTTASADVAYGSVAALLPFPWQLILVYGACKALQGS